MLQSIKFLRKKSRGEVEGDTKPTPLAPVILGLVPRIFWQQGTNLVNKLALLNKCRGRGLSAFCMFFKYPAPAGNPAPSPAQGEGMHRPWCDKILGTRPSMTGARVANSFGRSMIEMLGVLAIIGVLSVGGIAGYSKAMEMFKINKAVGEYSMLAAGLLEHVDYFNNLNKDSTQYPLVETVKALNLVPETWGVESVQYMRDSWGNRLGIFTRSGHFQLEINLGKGNSKSSVKFCEAMMRDFAQPLSDTLYQAYFFRWNHPGTSYYGDKYCYESDGECLRNLKLTDINQICKSCVDDESLRYCSLILNF